jgi:hypothetical protein
MAGSVNNLRSHNFIYHDFSPTILSPTNLSRTTFYKSYTVISFEHQE